MAPASSVGVIDESRTLIQKSLRLYRQMKNKQKVEGRRRFKIWGRKYGKKDETEYKKHIKDNTNENIKKLEAYRKGVGTEKARNRGVGVGTAIVDIPLHIGSVVCYAFGVPAVANLATSITKPIGKFRRSYNLHRTKLGADGKPKFDSNGNVEKVETGVFKEAFLDTFCGGKNSEGKRKWIQIRRGFYKPVRGIVGLIPRTVAAALNLPGNIILAPFKIGALAVDNGGLGNAFSRIFGFSDEAPIDETPTLDLVRKVLFFGWLTEGLSIGDKKIGLKPFAKLIEGDPLPPSTRRVFKEQDLQMRYYLAFNDKTMKVDDGGQITYVDIEDDRQKITGDQKEVILGMFCQEYQLLVNEWGTETTETREKGMEFAKDLLKGKKFDSNDEKMAIELVKLRFGRQGMGIDKNYKEEILEELKKGFRVVEVQKPDDELPPAVGGDGTELSSI